MANGNIADYIAKGVDMNGKIELARDALSGLEYLQNREPPVVHGNITPSNFLINESGKAVLCDIGLTMINWHPISTRPTASARWSSPEVNLGGSAVVQSDIWSWACVLLQLVARDPPYIHIQSEDHIKAAMSLGKRSLLTPEAFHELDDLPDDLLQLLGQCWKFDFAERPDACECMDALNSMYSADSGGGQTESMQHLSTGLRNKTLTHTTSGRHDTERQPSPVDIRDSKRLGTASGGSGEEVIRELMSFKTFKREADNSHYSEHPHVLNVTGTDKTQTHISFLGPLAKKGTSLEYFSHRPGRTRVWLEIQGALPKPQPTRCEEEHPALDVWLCEMSDGEPHEPEEELPGIENVNPNPLDNKRLRQHMDTLWALEHENVLAFIGYSVGIDFETVSLITHHMANGNLTNYVNKDLGMSRRFELARDIANGLQYLHSRDSPVIHGNLTP
ncbi:Nuclear receptor sub 2 group C member 2, partial [Tulasnella sp. 417]